MIGRLEYMIRANGLTDRPIEERKHDLFEIERYVNGLSTFIDECETPMTVAIQGDWGSGKTSLMNMVKAELSKSNILPVWFNTWEFSQFNMDENLAISFLTYLSEKLYEASGKKTGEAFKQNIVKIGTTAVKTVGAAVDLLSGGNGAVTNELIHQLLSKETVDSVKAIDNLKENFQKIVNEVCDKKIQKIVFFIDDLDRLQPVRAVELLEILKLFLDCEKCVFVLAIDYEVVSQGIKQKYNNTLDEKKGRKFFEKIIQVPFKMPVAHYNISKYIKSSLEIIGIEEKDENNLRYYEALISNSIGYNPRAMKRTFNAYLLLTKVNAGLEQKSVLNRLLLFGCLCLQLNYEKVYNYIVTHLEKDEMDPERFVLDEVFFENVSNDGITEETCDWELYSIIHDDKDYDDNQLAEFIKEISKLLKGDNESVTEESVNQLKEVLSLTSITATQQVILGNGIEGRGRRKEKVLKKDLVNASPDIEKSNVSSYNGMRVSHYEIAGEKIDCTEEKFNCATFLAQALKYALENKTEDFIRLYEDVRSGVISDKVLYSLFTPEKSKKPESIRVISNDDEKITVSVYSSNDKKMSQICRVYEKLDLDVQSIRLYMYEAVEMNTKE